MTNIYNAEEMLASDKNIIKKNKSRLPGIVVAVAGLALCAVSYLAELGAGLSNAALMIGFMFTVAGILMTLLPQSRLVFSPTGENIMRKKFSFEQNDMVKAQEILRSGLIDELKKISTGNSTPVIAVVYYTRSGSYWASQMYRYVPYEYQPVEEPFVFIQPNVHP